MNNNRPVKTFIILGSIFLGVALIFILFELYLNFESMRLVAESKNAQGESFGTALGRAIGVGFLYIYAVASGITGIVFSIPVIPFSITILTRQKNNVCGIIFLVLAILFIIAAIGTMFILPYSNSSASSSYVSSY